MVQLLIYIRNIILIAIQIYRFLLIIYFLMSWMPDAYRTSLGQFFIRICEPFVGIFREFIPPIGMISIAGMVAYFSLFLVSEGITQIFRIIIGFLI